MPILVKFKLLANDCNGYWLVSSDRSPHNTH